MPSRSRKSPSRKSVSRKSPSRKSVSPRKSASRKSVSRKSPSRKSVSRKSPSRKSASRKSVSRKSPSRKSRVSKHNSEASNESVLLSARKSTRSARKSTRSARKSTRSARKSKRSARKSKRSARVSNKKVDPEECPICFGPLGMPYLKTKCCKQNFCNKGCLSGITKCPLCRYGSKAGELFETLKANNNPNSCGQCGKTLSTSCIETSCGHRFHTNCKNALLGGCPVCGNHKLFWEKIQLKSRKEKKFGEFTVYVQMLSGEEMTFNLNSGMKTDILKNMIQEQKNIPESRIRLTVMKDNGDVTLKDKQLISDYVQDGDTIYLVVMDNIRLRNIRDRFLSGEGGKLKGGELTKVLHDIMSIGNQLMEEERHETVTQFASVIDKKNIGMTEEGMGPSDQVALFAGFAQNPTIETIKYSCRIMYSDSLAHLASMMRSGQLRKLRIHNVVNFQQGFDELCNAMISSNIDTFEIHCPNMKFHLPEDQLDMLINAIENSSSLRTVEFGEVLERYYFKDPNPAFAKLAPKLRGQIDRILQACQNNPSITHFNDKRLHFKKDAKNAGKAAREEGLSRKVSGKVSRKVSRSKRSNKSGKSKRSVRSKQ